MWLTLWSVQSCVVVVVENQTDALTSETSDERLHRSFLVDLQRLALCTEIDVTATDDYEFSWTQCSDRRDFTCTSRKTVITDLVVAPVGTPYTSPPKLIKLYFKEAHSYNVFKTLNSFINLQAVYGIYLHKVYSLQVIIHY